MKKQNGAKKGKKEKNKLKKWEDPEVIELFDIDEKEIANFATIWK